jgi:hypothetical protein
MIAVALVLNVLLPVTIIVWTVWRVKKAGRAATPALLLGSVLLTLDVLGFAMFSVSLDRPEREKWSKYFPEGTHALGLMFFTGIIVIACIADRFLRKPNGNETRN